MKVCHNYYNIAFWPESRKEEDALSQIAKRLGIKVINNPSPVLYIDLEIESSRY